VQERNENWAVLKRAGAASDADFPISDVALALSALDQPDLDLGPYHAHLSEITTQVGAAAGEVSNGASRVAALSTVISEEFGYRGDAETYDAPENADIAHVIDRRRGLPVALGVIYLHAARALGWPAYGVNFPGHFVLKMSDPIAAIRFDPFRNGAVLADADLRSLLSRLSGHEVELQDHFFEQMDDRQILIRLLNNQKTRALAAQDTDRALEVLARMTAISPAVAEIWFEYGAIGAGQGNLVAATKAFETVVILDENGPLGRRAAQARGKLNRSLN
jgi:regulator of sirC expression with transglutaminase-like and TPR domain